MEQILTVGRRLYQKNFDIIYKNAIYLSCDGKMVRCDPLHDVMLERNERNIFISRVDQISDRLAFLETEYQDDSAYCTEVWGLIHFSGNWKVVCALGSYAQQRFASLYKQENRRQMDSLHHIEQILLQYCGAVYRMDAENCLQLFWPQTRMFHPNEDQSFSDVPIQVLHKRWSNMPDPQALEVSEFSRIYHIELLDDNTAVAKIGCAKLETFFKDYLFLMRVQNQWTIVNKMTHALYAGKRI